MSGTLSDFWTWLNTPYYGVTTGSGETPTEGYGLPGGSPGDTGGETNTPIDSATGLPIPPTPLTSASSQPTIFGVRMGTLIWIGVAVVIVNGAMNVASGGNGRRRR